MTKKELKEILNKHLKWLRGEGGERANLSGANLSGANLSEANLSRAILSRANLSGANLSEAILYGADLSRAILSRADLSEANLSRANLYGADLYGADLSRAILSGANLSGANLSEANLSGANLYGANLSEANLSRAILSGANLYGAENVDEAKWSIYTAFYPLQCPEKGTYTAYKKAGGLIVELEIPADAQRSSATSRKCRASKAKVVSITDIDGNEAGASVQSDHDGAFVYTVGKVVEVSNFDTNRWNECAPGIHHYITRAEAVKHA